MFFVFKNSSARKFRLLVSKLKVRWLSMFYLLSLVGSKGTYYVGRFFRDYIFLFPKNHQQLDV